MSTTSDSATSPLSPAGAAEPESAAVPAEALEGDELDDDLGDDLGERLHAMSQCTPGDAEQILDLLANPQPLSEEAKAVHEAGLARFAARFRIVNPR